MKSDWSVELNEQIFGYLGLFTFGLGSALSVHIMKASHQINPEILYGTVRAGFYLLYDRRLDIPIALLVGISIPLVLQFPDH